MESFKGIFLFFYNSFIYNGLHFVVCFCIIKNKSELIKIPNFGGTIMNHSFK